MDNIKKWSILISVTYVVCILVKILIPPGSVSKTMSKVLGIFIICSLVVNFSNEFKKASVDINSIFQIQKINLNNNFSETIESQALELANNNIRTLIKSKLNDIKVYPKKIEIYMDTNEDNCIVMIKCKIFLEKEYSLYKSQIRDEILRDLNIQTEFIDV